MPLSSKFLTDSTAGEIVKIGQYLAKIWTKCDSFLFWPTLFIYCAIIPWRLLYRSCKPHQ